MCGITGLISPGSDLRIIQAMTASLKHRGPDDTGHWTDGPAAFGHTRLSIIDLTEAGHQPMVLNDLVMVYNGEIYNHAQLAARLPGPFSSHTDSEVILHMYSKHGKDCLNYLNGMFAFAIWDRKRRRLFAARDRIGIKPFIYRTLPNKGFAFASEIKALLPLGQPNLDKSAIRDYLLYGYIPSPKTIYHGIAKLPAGHRLEWKDGELQIERYWTPSPNIKLTDHISAQEQLDDILGRVIPDHTMSDVPLGVFLSGGIDSPTIAYFLDRPKTFTLGLDSKSRSEATAAKAVADHLGTDHREITANATDLEVALKTIPRVYDEPFGDSGAWTAYIISELARKEVTVALSGEGGDELFCGYRRYWQGAGNRSNILNRTLARYLPPLSRLGHSVHRRSARELEGYAAMQGGLFPRQVQELLSDEYLERDYDYLWFYRLHWHEELHPAQKMRWLDLNTNLSECLLQKIDRASMAHSLEVRPPLLDHRLIEFALSIHPDLLIDQENGLGKVLLRQLMEPRLPRGHMNHPKHGFGLPVRNWIKQFPKMFDEAQNRLKDAGILRGKVSCNFRRAWYLLVLDAWICQSG